MQQQAAGPDYSQQRGALQTLRTAIAQLQQQRPAQGQHKTGQPDAAQRCQSGQRAVQLAVAGIQPGKTGQKPAAKGVAGYPEGGKRGGFPQPAARAAQKAYPEPAMQRLKQCQTRYKQQGEQAGQYGRGRAVIMDADIYPAGTG